jgi:hypothetical protein
MPGEIPQYSPDFEEKEVSPKHADMDPSLLAAAAKLSESGESEASADVMKAVGEKASSEYAEKREQLGKQVDEIQRTYMTQALEQGPTHWSADRIARDVVAIDELKEYPEFFTTIAKNVLTSENRNDFTGMYGAGLFMSEIPDAINLADFCRQKGIKLEGKTPKELKELGFERVDEKRDTRYHYIGLANEYLKAQEQ